MTDNSCPKSQPKLVAIWHADAGRRTMLRATHDGCAGKANWFRISSGLTGIARTFGRACGHLLDLPGRCSNCGIRFAPIAGWNFDMPRRAGREFRKARSIAGPFGALYLRAELSPCRIDKNGSRHSRGIPAAIGPYAEWLGFEDFNPHCHARLLRHTAKPCAANTLLNNISSL